jgi:peptide/nickel transport system ATP-binding protein
MAQRVIIALALICSPQLVIADEPTTGLDLTIQAQILDLIKDTVSRNGMSAIIVTHDLGIVARYCESVAVMYGGELVEVGPVSSFFQGPTHPYSLALLKSSSLNHAGARLRIMKPSTRNSTNDGCVYHGVCPLAQPICRSMRPTLNRVLGDHLVRCHRASELLDVPNTARSAFVDDASRNIGGA